jgi:hypothetical protein
MWLLPLAAVCRGVCLAAPVATPSLGVLLLLVRTGNVVSFLQTAPCFSMGVGGRRWDAFGIQGRGGGSEGGGSLMSVLQLLLCACCVCLSLRVCTC